MHVVPCGQHLRQQCVAMQCIKGFMSYAGRVRVLIAGMPGCRPVAIPRPRSQHAGLPARYIIVGQHNQSVRVSAWWLVANSVCWYAGVLAVGLPRSALHC
jgi:hypothetical protein